MAKRGTNLDEAMELAWAPPPSTQPTLWRSILADHRDRPRWMWLVDVALLVPWVVALVLLWRSPGPASTPTRLLLATTTLAGPAWSAASARIAARGRMRDR